MAAISNSRSPYVLKNHQKWQKQPPDWQHTSSQLSQHHFVPRKLGEHGVVRDLCSQTPSLHLCWRCGHGVGMACGGDRQARQGANWRPCCCPRSAVYRMVPGLPAPLRRGDLMAWVHLWQQGCSMGLLHVVPCGSFSQVAQFLPLIFLGCLQEGEIPSLRDYYPWLSVGVVKYMK